MAILIRVEEGDITGFQGDGLVNAANNHLVLGAGVAGAIRLRGGPRIQEECDEYVRKHGPIAVGDAVVTGAGDLNVHWVIHAAAMGDAPPTGDSIRAATRASLALASKHEMASVAFPVLGTGVGGFPFSEAARIMVEEVRTFDPANGFPDAVVFYGYTPDQATTFRFLLT